MSHLNNVTLHRFFFLICGEMETELFVMNYLDRHLVLSPAFWELSILKRAFVQFKMKFL